KSLGEIPRPVTTGAKETLKIRTQKEIFGTKECQEWYINAVKEAIEKLNPDKLYEFIKAHGIYNKEGFSRWNNEFAALLSLNVPEKYRGSSAEMTNRRITAATQHVLVEYYNNDVFQLTVKKVNPWIWIDGWYGPYTNSVMGDYWNTVHGPARPENAPLGRSDLGRSYPPGGSSQKTYAAAMAWLTTQLTGSTRDTVKPQENVPAEKQLAKKVSSAPEAITDLVIRHHEVKKNQNLKSALKEAYYSTYSDTSKAKDLSEKALNAIPSNKTAELNKQVQKGDLLKITTAGLLQVLGPRNVSKYEIQMEKPKHA
ncbi:MAG: hypothetical protein V1880_02805, partial [Patescibacteria group bacterium]